MNGKPWYASWTIWFNVAIFLVGVVNQLGQIIPLPTQVLVYVGIVGNVLLRFKTAVPIVTGDDSQM